MPKSEQPQIERFLSVRGWKRDVNPLGEISYQDKGGEWCVEVNEFGWQLRAFTDADVETECGPVAQGRFELVTEGDTLNELRDSMVEEGAMAWECPNCGESGGKPEEVRSREWQGDEAHGGWVTFVEECCSKCLRPSGPDADDARDVRIAMEFDEQECPF